MSKAKARDGVYYRADRRGWWGCYIDATGTRQRRRLEAHTRQQAMDALGLIKAEEEKTRRTGVRPASDITLEALFERYKRHQKTRIRSTTYARLDDRRRWPDQVASYCRIQTHNQCRQDTSYS